MNILQLHNLIKAHGFIAGGACRALYQNEEIKDFDIFCYSKEDYEPLKAILNNMYGTKIENSMTYTVGKVQLIKPRENEYIKTYGSPYAVVSKFDFSICRGYFDGTSHIFIDANFEEDAKKKRLVIENIVCPISSTRRAMKYAKKGYKLGILEILKLFDEFRKRNLGDDFFNELKDIKDEDIYMFLEKYNID